MLRFRNKLLPVTASTIAAALGFAALAVSKHPADPADGHLDRHRLTDLPGSSRTRCFPALQRVLRTPTAPAGRDTQPAYDRVRARCPSSRSATARRSSPPRSRSASRARSRSPACQAVGGVPSTTTCSTHRSGEHSGPRPALVPRSRDGSQRRARVGPPAARRARPIPRSCARSIVPHRSRDDARVSPACPARRRRCACAATSPATARRCPPIRLRSRARSRTSSSCCLPSLTCAPSSIAGASPTSSSPFCSAMVKPPAYRALTRRASTTRGQRDVATSPALAGASMHVVGEALLTAKVGASLVPTLAEASCSPSSLILDRVPVVFRSGTERLLAMIPSVFALLVTFLGLRLFGGSLERRDDHHRDHGARHDRERSDALLPSHARAIRRAARRRASATRCAIAGRAIVFATLINAVGFLGLAPSSFPPLRQFGLMTASAFVLALLADFLVLPAALWLASGERPASEADRAERSRARDGATARLQAGRARTASPSGTR